MHSRTRQPPVPLPAACSVTLTPKSPAPCTPLGEMSGVSVTALEAGTPVIHSGLGDNLAFRKTIETGEVDSAFAKADLVTASQLPALRSLLRADRTAMLEAGRRCRDSARHYEWDRVAEQQERFYEEVANEAA